MASLATMMAIGAMWTMLSDAPREVYMGYNNYYTQLLEVCENRAGRACCRASVRAMRNEGAKPIKLSEESCHAGYKAVSLRCPASLNWCRANSDIKPVTYRR